MELGLGQRWSESYPVFSRSNGLASFLCVMGRNINSQIDLSEITSLEKGSPIRVPRIKNHFGTVKAWANINHDLLWSGVMADVDAYIRSCDPCWQNKSSTQAPPGFLHPLPVPVN